MRLCKVKKTSMLRIAVIFTFVLLIGLLVIQAEAQIDGSLGQQSKPTALPTPTIVASKSDLDAVETAVFNEIANRKQNEFLFSAYSTRLDKVEISADSQYAYAWMGIVDPTTGESIPTEPGLALLQFDGVEWQVTFPVDTNWESLLNDIPPDLIPTVEKDAWLNQNAVYADVLPVAPISGYRLPWEAGRTVYLSGSVAHDEYIPSGNSHYAFDFYIPGVMFNLFSSRAGTVYMYHDSQPNGDDNSPGNYLVLKDTTTNPVTYQLYLHLAQASIPPELRNIGAQVARGQFIGVADDTGASTGHHLHFQVHTNPSSYWGKAVDIIFDDVDINGGRPRIQKDKPYCTWAGDVCNSFRTAYVSGNTKSDPNPPTGNIIGFINGDLIDTASVDIFGWAVDEESGLRNVQIIASYNNEMHDIGPVYTSSPFSFTFNVCQAGVLDGPVSLGLRISDQQSNIAFLPGLVTLTKNYRCTIPPAPCQANSNQVALFSLPDFQGECVILNTGSFLANSFGSVGDNNLESIQIGNNVMATLFADLNYSGRAATLLEDNSNLSDDLVNSNAVSSIIVVPKTQNPSIPQPVWPYPNSTYTPGYPLTLYWRNTGGTTEFQAQILDSSGTKNPIASEWMKVPYWTLGSELDFLVPGTYTWQVRGRNQSGTSSWSIPIGLTVLESAPAGSIQGGLPFQDDVEVLRDWTATGLWHREAGMSPIPAHSGNYYWWFGEASNGDERYFSAKQGTLTSPNFDLPAGSAYFLRFWYAYQTESMMDFWDQRWVQISVDGGPFLNQLQLSGETMNSTGYAVWLPSPVVDLSNFAGSSIRIRFIFDTIEPSGNKPDNDFEGWFIDDISITTQPSPSCPNLNEPNGTPEQATVLTYSPSSMITTEICPNGDLDFYKFWGIAGDLVAANTDAQNQGSSLDTVLTLYDSDGRSILTENDDEDNAGGILDSLLVYRIRRTGWYYLKVRSWDYPAGGASYTYTLRLLSDDSPPTIDLLMPDGGFYRANPIILHAQAVDHESAIDRVRFYWHNLDWSNPVWDYIGEGVMNGGIWEVSFDPSSKLEGSGGAFYAIAYDLSGNTASDGAWNQILDFTPPLTSIQKLSPTQTTNLIHLQWQGQDALSGVKGYDVEVSVDGGAWTSAGNRYFQPQTSTYYPVAPGHLYAYRIRGIDQAGNLESYPSVEDTVTYVPSANDLCNNLDEFENDNTSNQAYMVTLDGLVREHNFCNPNQVNFTGDQDWIHFQATANQQITVMASPDPGSPAFIKLVLYQKVGNNLVEFKQVESSGYGLPVWLNWTAPDPQEYYLFSSSVNPALIGKGAGYWMQVYPGPPRIVTLPVLQK